MKLPVHRWVRFSAGFSAEWVARVIRDCGLGNDSLVFDPFAGSGTTILAGESVGIRALGIEAHPFVVRVGRAKLGWHSDVGAFHRLSQEIISLAAGGQTPEHHDYPRLIHQCYPPGILRDLDSLRWACEMKADGGLASELCWLALTSILRVCSPVGTSQMELIQPKKRKQNTARPFEAFRGQVSLMCQDMAYAQSAGWQPNGAEVIGDARTCTSVPDCGVDLVITSPPYANNFDYADATRLEMSFWGEVTGWSDLQETVRKHLMRSCVQHVSAEGLQLGRILSARELTAIGTEMEPVCRDLENQRGLHGGKKNYHLMVAAYFLDMSKVWTALRRVCRPGSRVCFVIGDSAPYGVYVPVIEWTGQLALAAGFAAFAFERTRERNVKWQNRKHRVPLCEGRLWVSG
jgi:hypothetical protein